ncbi:MAG: YeeE/YedE family protein [Rhizobiaceae bacterium]|nr:YeeE/YedE family protein [Rhizobiaceae bacterium]
MIESLRESVLENPGHIVMWGGLVIGMVFGFTIYRTNFCTMGSISDIIALSDYRRFRAWLLAAAVAVLGAWWVETAGVTDLANTMYMTPNLNWAGNIIGGALFGFGMAFAGGCVSRNLVRTGGGDIRSLMVLIVTGIFGYMTIGGILGPIRANIESASAVDLSEMGLEDQGVGSMLASVSGMDSATGHTIMILVIVAVIFLYCFKDQQFRQSKTHIVSGVVIGACVTAGWVLTGLAADEFADVAVPVGSLTFVRPSGDAIEYLMRFTALGFPNFGISTLVGTILGAFIAAKVAGRFRLATFADSTDTLRNLFGAMLMGIGGVMALGCTVGQAVTGVSTLAFGSMLTFAAIVAGGFLGVNYLNRLIMAEI